MKQLLLEAPRERERLNGLGSYGMPSNLASWIGVLLLAVLAGTLAGCKPREAIHEVSVPKPRRLLGALLLDETNKTAWIVQLSGPSSMVTRNESDFREFVKSFAVDTELNTADWKAPLRWRAINPNTGDRNLVAEFSVTPLIIGAEDAGSDEEVESLEVTYDTVDLSTREPQESSQEDSQVLPEAKSYELYRVRVLKLTLPSAGDLNEFRRAIINRWHRDLGASEVSAAEFSEKFAAVDNNGLPATWVDVFGRLPDLAETNLPGASPAPTAVSPMRTAMNFDMPEGWTEPATGAALATLTLEKPDGNAKGQVTVSLMNAQVPWVAQAERWAGQVGLSLAPADIESRTERVTVSGLPTERIDLQSQEPEAPDAQRIIALRAVAGDAAWFIRIRGTPAFIEAERERFDAFVESLELPPVQ